MKIRLLNNEIEGKKKESYYQRVLDVKLGVLDE